MILSSSDGFNWTRRYPQPDNFEFGQVKPLFDAVWADNQWVAVGQDGESATSPDGINWTRHPRRTLDEFYGVTWAEGQYLAAASGGIHVSEDGKEWEKSTGMYDGSFMQSVAYHDGLYVTVGHDGAIESSGEGYEWTNRGSVEQDTHFHYSFFLNGEVCIVAPDHGNTITSADGETWSGKIITEGVLPNAVIPTANGGVMLLGDDGKIEIFDSTGYSSPDSGTLAPLHGGCWSGDQYVVVGGLGTILTSPDGQTWTQRSSGGTDILWNVTWTGVHFVIVSDENVLTSPDGVTWTPGTLTDQRTVVYADGAVFAFSRGSVRVSRDHGITWSEPLWIRADSIRGVTWTGHALIAVGDNGEIWMSRRDYNPEYVKWLEIKHVKPFESAPLQDTNRDGVTNLIAFALDLSNENSLSADERARTPYVNVNEAGTGITLSFEKPKERAAVKYIVETAAVSPEIWTSVAQKLPGTPWTGAAAVNETDSVEGRVKVDVSYSENIAEQGGRLMRLKVELLDADLP